MKKNIQRSLLQALKSKAVLAVAGGLVLVSCGTYMGGYSETDGVYYDPNTDTLPEGVVMNQGNQVGEYYDYQAVENNYPNKVLYEGGNTSWNSGNYDSDWGNYTGTSTYYSDWGWNPGFYNGFGWGLGYGFGSSWMWGAYNPFWDFYSPFGFGFGPYYGYYNPYFYNPYGFYSPWYGGFYGSPYMGYGYGYGNGYGYGYNSYRAPSFKRTGADGAFRNTNTNRTPNVNNNNGFRNTIPNQSATTPRVRNVPQNSEPRYRTNQSTPRTNTRSVEPRYRSNSSDSGFRSGGNTGGFRSGGSSGGFNYGGGSRSSGGGFRR